MESNDLLTRAGYHTIDCSKNKIIFYNNSSETDITLSCYKWDGIGISLGLGIWIGIRAEC